MDETYYAKLRIIHRTNRVLWTSVLTGMIVLLIVSFMMKYFNYVSSDAVQTNPQFENIMFLFTIGLLILIFYLKRHYLVAENIVKRAKTKNIAITSSDIADFVAQFKNSDDTMAKTLVLMRRYFMLVWSVANVVLLIGFIAFILGNQSQTLLIYTVVSLYSMVINFPSFKLIESCHKILTE